MSNYLVTDLNMAESEVFDNSTGDYCAPGLLLPLMDESGWNRTIRAIIYFLFLLYAFVGVSVVTDVFMASVVAITSKTRKIYLAQTRSKKVCIKRVGASS